MLLDHPLALPVVDARTPLGSTAGIVDEVVDPDLPGCFRQVLALALRGEVSALVVGQPKAAPLQLFLEDPVLLHQVLDDVLLVTVDPTREGHEPQPQGREGGLHCPILPGVGNR
jgi:hypothetical protein